MNTTYKKFGFAHSPAGATRQESRCNTDWGKFSNDDLKFALDVLSLHHSPFEVDAMNEIQKRIEAGTWLDLEKPPPPLAETMPKWLKVFPFSLLWSQRPR